MHEPQERSYGVIPYRIGTRGIELLMVRQVNGNHWTFPKGHAEEGETVEQTMVRELYEETGISEIELQEEPVFEERYTFEREGVFVDKLVVYRLGKTLNDESHYHDTTGEILERLWGTPEELLQLSLFPEKRALLEEVQKYVCTDVR